MRILAGSRFLIPKHTTNVAWPLPSHQLFAFDYALQLTVASNVRGFIDHLSPSGEQDGQSSEQNYVPAPPPMLFASRLFASSSVTLVAVLCRRRTIDQTPGMSR
jgi:hypothetical protein